MQLKSSWKSGEGQGMWVKLIGAGFFIYEIINPEGPSTDELLSMAQNSTQFADILQAKYQTINWNELGVLGGILAFIFADGNNFLKSRTALKQKANGGTGDGSSTDPAVR